MTRRKNKLSAYGAQYLDLSSERLMQIFDAIGTRPDDRVKATGHVRLRMAKFGDAILDEVRRRRLATETEDRTNG